MRFRIPHIPKLLSFLALSLLAQAGCLLLFALSQFGQNPLPALPAIEILFFGMLFAAPLAGLRHTMGQRGGLAVGLALLANLALWLFLTAFARAAALYGLAPLAALGLAELLPRTFGRYAPLAGAMSVYIVCTLLANYTFDSFLPLPVYGLVNVGTLFFGVTFTQRDRVHQYGRKYAYLMIGLAAILNVLVALSVGTPLRYVAVGFLAILLSETADTEVYQRFIRRRWLARVATSNAVSIPIDTIVFTVLAFAGESFATPAWMLEVVVTDIVVKLVVGFLAALRVAWGRSVAVEHHPAQAGPEF
ncbi:MAG TPA: VUT family protein [Trueperaceae bacterium]